MRLTRLFFTGGVAAIVVLSAVSTRVAAADDKAQPASEKLVTMELTGAPVIDAIDLLFKDTGYKYTIEPGVSGTVDLRLTNIPFRRALRLVAESANLEYQSAAGRYIIRPKPAPVPKVAAQSPTVRLINGNEPSNGALPATTPEEAIPAQPNSYGELPGEGPIYYGHDGMIYDMPVPFIFDNPGLYYPPPGTFLSFGSHLSVPQLLPPMGLRSPSMQRMIQQMQSVLSIPGFQGYPFGTGYGY